jgi:hypothetical protein
VGFAYLQTAADSANASTYTYTSQSLGAAAADRYIVVGVASRIGAASLTLSSLTVGGVTATIVDQRSATGVASGGTATTLGALAIAAVPTGTTGNVVVNLSATALRCVVSMWRFDGLASATAFAAGDSAATAPTINLDIPANGAAVGIITAGYSGSLTASWTGLTEQYDATTEALAVSSASDAIISAETGRTVTGTFTGTPFEPVGVFASWQMVDRPALFHSHYQNQGWL